MYEDLVNRLNSRSRATRETAENQLATLSPAGLAQAGRIAIQMQRSRTSRLRRFVILPWAIFTLACLFIGSVYQVDLCNKLVATLAFPFSCVNIWIYSPSRASRAIARACRQVETLETPAVALALLESWMGRDTIRGWQLITPGLEFQTDAERVITSGLSNLSTERIMALTSTQCKAIAWLLKSPFTNAPLTHVALRILSMAGGRDELSAVRKLTTVAGVRQRKEIADAARACAEAMQQRLDNRRDEDTLLRPAIAAESADVLLRPLTAGSTTDSQLVRPVDVS